jgi:hypothetical protein
MLKSLHLIFDPSKLYAMHLMGRREGGREGNNMLRRVKVVMFQLLN